MVTDAKLQQERMEERLSVVERDLENRTFDTQGLRTSIERQVTAVQGDVAATLKSLDYDGKLLELKSKLREVMDGLPQDLMRLVNWDEWLSNRITATEREQERVAKEMLEQQLKLQQIAERALQVVKMVVSEVAEGVSQVSQRAELAPQRFAEAEQLTAPAPLCLPNPPAASPAGQPGAPPPKIAPAKQPLPCKPPPGLPHKAPPALPWSLAPALAPASTPLARCPPESAAVGTGPGSVPCDPAAPGPRQEVATPPGGPPRIPVKAPPLAGDGIPVKAPPLAAVNWNPSPPSDGIHVKAPPLAAVNWIPMLFGPPGPATNADAAGGAAAARFSKRPPV